MVDEATEFYVVVVVVVVSSVVAAIPKPRHPPSLPTAAARASLDFTVVKWCVW